MWVFLENTWVSGLRSRSFLAVFLLGVLLVGVAYLAGLFSPRQPATVTLDVGFSLTRVSLVLLVLSWVQEMVSREVDRRTVLFAITYPIPPTTYLLGRYAGIMLLAAAATLVLGLLLWLAVFATAASYDQQFRPALGWPYWACLFGLWCDVAVVGAFTLLIAALATVHAMPLALGLAFAVCGKSLGAVRQYLGQGAEGDKSLVAIYQPVLDIVQWFLPDLSRLDWRVWPMYGLTPDTSAVGLAMVMAAAYIGVMLWFAAGAFARREFK